METCLVLTLACAAAPMAITARGGDRAIETVTEAGTQDSTPLRHCRARTR